MPVVERDASARATHLEAATRKFLVTTIERKQMSTKTNFKRIALVAVAALGMGLLSSVPSQAAFSGSAGSQLTVTVTGGTGALSASGAASDSTTAGTVSVSGLALAASDSYTVTSSIKSVPAAATLGTAPSLLFMYIDTATSTGATNLIGITGNDTTTARTTGLIGTGNTAFSGSLNSTTDSRTTVSATAGAANTYVGAKWFAYQDTGSTRVAGSYVYTIIVTPSSVIGGAGTAQTVDLTITIAAAAADSLVASSAFSTVFINPTSGTQADAAVSSLSTASDTARGFLNVTLRNASNVAVARESVTITTTIGTVGDGTVRGRSVVVKYTGSATAYSIFSDGTAGTGTITVSTPSVTFATKSVNFYTAAAKTITATVAHPALKVGANDGAVRGTAVDANGTAWTGTAYIVASSAADALIAGSTTPVSCGTYDSTNARFNCPVTALTAGTAKFKIIDAATVALATATSNEVTVTVSAAAVAKVAISFDKATYAPNERMRIYVTPQDASGNALPANTYTNLFATGGITANSGFSGTSDTTSAVSVITSAASSSVTGARAGAAMYTVYAPAAGGTVTITAVGGTSLPTAAQVAVTATATVTDSGAAALAAVTALATTVASLKTLITTLTNLVLKIQKKVKA